MCENEAVGKTWHPILNWVPICMRCAKKHSLLITLPTGDTQCPNCETLNPDVPEGGERCEVCVNFVDV